MMEHLSIVFDVIKNLITFDLATVQKHEWEIFQGYGFFALVMFFVNSIICVFVSFI